ncbi:MAG: hypothetical protein QHH18_05685 [Candidatus Bathyarchaeota archaeon]|jgi:hypothetical protein|nr:hypothetical protein [Candidatus Bathyarchaeota archaeon A05DMB-5]MDH7558080.1 hypothetical protein [Candidatus Bathyarchaeota archaeon]
MVQVKKVNLLKTVNIDSITIRKDHYFPKAYVIDFPLDSEPDHVWQDIFEREWRTSRHLWDRKLFLIGDTLRLVATPEGMEEKINWVKEVIAATNKGVEDYNRRMSVTVDAKPETQRIIIEHDEVVERIRAALKRVLQA